jgi:hypothetical protein
MPCTCVSSAVELCSTRTRYIIPVCGNCINHSHRQLLYSYSLLVHFLCHMWPIECGLFRYIIWAYVGVPLFLFCQFCVAAFTLAFCSSVLSVSCRLTVLYPFTRFWFGCQLINTASVPPAWGYNSVLLLCFVGILSSGCARSILFVLIWMSAHISCLFQVFLLLESTHFFRGCSLLQATKVVMSWPSWQGKTLQKWGGKAEI